MCVCSLGFLLCLLFFFALLAVVPLSLCARAAGHGWRIKLKNRLERGVRAFLFFQGFVCLFTCQFFDFKDDITSLIFLVG